MSEHTTNEPKIGIEIDHNIDVRVTTHGVASADEWSGWAEAGGGSSASFVGGGSVMPGASPAGGGGAGGGGAGGGGAGGAGAGGAGAGGGDTGAASGGGSVGGEHQADIDPSLLEGTEGLDDIVVTVPPNLQPGDQAIDEQGNPIPGTGEDDTPEPPTDGGNDGDTDGGEGTDGGTDGGEGTDGNDGDTGAEALPENVDRLITKDGELKPDETVITPDGTQIDTGKNHTKISLENGTTIAVKPDGTVTVNEVQEDGAEVEHEINGDGDVNLTDGTKIKVENGVTTVITPDKEKIVIDDKGTTVDLPDDKDGKDDEKPEDEKPEDEKPEEEKPEDPAAGMPSPGGGNTGGGGGGNNNGGGDNGGTQGKGTTEEEGEDCEDEDDGEPKKTDCPPVNPPTDDLCVSPEALRTDGRRWCQIAENFCKIGENVQTISCTPVEYGLAFPIKKGYEAIVTAFADLVAGGSAEFNEIAQKLEMTAREYERNEEEGAQLAQTIN